MVKLDTHLYDTKEDAIRAKIKQRRLQILVHSYLYYKLADTVIEDDKYDRFGKELFELQTEYPELATQVIYAKEFADYDPCSGFYLPYSLPEIEQSALKLRNYIRPPKEKKNEKRKRKN